MNIYEQSLILIENNESVMKLNETVSKIKDSSDVDLKVSKFEKSLLDKQNELKKNGINIDLIEIEVEKRLSQNNMSFKEVFLYAINEFKEQSLKDKTKSIGIGVLLVFIILVIQLMLFYVVMNIFESSGMDHNQAYLLSMSVLAIIVAPLTEEFAKKISVEKKSTLSHFIGFQYIEFIPRLVIGQIAGIIPLLMHIYNTKKHIEAEKIKQLHPNDNLINSNIKAMNTKFAIFVHMAWNFIASLPFIILAFNKNRDNFNLPDALDAFIDKIKTIT